MLLLLLFNFVGLSLASCPAGSKEIPGTAQCAFLHTNGENYGYFQSHYVCNQLGGELLSIHNGFTSGILYVAAQEANVTGLIYIGSDKTRNQTWSWIDASKWDYQPAWAPGEPEPFRNRDCAVLNMFDLRWYAAYCADTHPYFCDLPAQECPSDWLSFNGSCYMIYEDEGMNWDSSRSKCMEYGADLASIHSSEENAFIIQLARRTHPYSQYESSWIGLKCESADNRTYSWTDGTPVTINNSTECYYTPSAYTVYWGQYPSAGSWEPHSTTIYGKSAICKKPFLSTILMRISREDALNRGVRTSRDQHLDRESANSMK